MSLNRRSVIAALGAAAMTPVTLAPVAARAQTEGADSLPATELGVEPNTGADQTQALQSAVTRAASDGRPLFLPGGSYQVRSLTLPSLSTLTGVAGATRLVALESGAVLAAIGQRSLRLQGLLLDGSGIGPDDRLGGLLYLESCADVGIEDVTVGNTGGHGIFLRSVSGRIAASHVERAGRAGIFSIDATGLAITGNSVTSCGNGGILVWRGAAGPDGTIVTENRISAIAARSGGSGQNGNGINVFQAGEVLVANNHISECAFSAVRVNACDDSLIRGNQCRAISEVAIFSEFGFSGSVIADNLIDGAAGGISMTNFDRGGHLATCSGNIVRNILAESPTNPDTVPFGIFAEADAAIAGNVVETVPGTGIGAGWGRFLRDVAVSGNVVRQARIGIAVSLAEGAGAASVTGNLVSGAEVAAIAGTRWREVAEPDLQANAGRYPQLTVAGNRIG